MGNVLFTKKIDVCKLTPGIKSDDPPNKKSAFLYTVRIYKK